MAQRQYLQLDPKQNLARQQLEHFASITDIQAWSEVLTHYAALKQAHPQQKVLLILDDAGQCAYTAMHAGMGDDLYFDFDESQDFQNLSADERVLVEEDFELYAFNFRLQQLQKPALQQDLTAFATKLVYDAADWQVLCEMNANPLPMMDQEIQVKLFDAPSDALKLAAMPNGYFDCDLNPFENFALIQHLEQQYALEFMGIGAALLGFVKMPSFNPTNIPALIADLCVVYHFDEQHQKALAEHLSQQDYLILSYTEALAE